MLMNFSFLYFQATIKVLDENDTPPKFSQSYYTESVPEDVELASTVATITVTDDDTIGSLQLTISEGSEGNFRIHQDGEWNQTKIILYQIRAWHILVPRNYTNPKKKKNNTINIYTNLDFSL